MVAAYKDDLVRNEYHYRFFGTFRLLLALTVVVSHLQAVFAPPSLRVILTPLAIGNIGVVMFFVVSGYVISEALTVFYSGRPKEFLTNRTLRIFPPYILALLFSLTVHAIICYLGFPIQGFQLSAEWLALNSPRTILYNFLAVFDFRIPAGREDYYLYVRYIWAVVIEFQFYVSAGLLFWLSRLLVAERRRLFVFLVFLTVGLYGLSIIVQLPPALKLIEFSPYFLTGICLFYLNRDASRQARCGILHVCAATASTLSLVCFYRYTLPQDTLIPLVAYGMILFCFVILASQTKERPQPLRKIDSWGLNSVTEPITKKLRDRIRGRTLVR